jgi:hypothetical protein
VVTAVVVAAWVALSRLTPVSAGTLVIALVLVGLLALSQAAVLARGATWDPALARLVFVGLSLFVVLLLGELVSAVAAVLTAALVAFLLAALIRSGRRVTAV